MLHKLLVSILATTFLMAFTSAALRGQVDTGAVLGTVRDQSGAVVPGAKITLTNEGTSASVSTATGATGAYTFTPVRVGTYSVAASMRGFKTVIHRHIKVNIQQQAAVDFTLVPGAVTQTVQVTSAAPLLQANTAAIGQVVGSQVINDLPLNGRNYTFLAQLSAGVTVAQYDTRGLDAHGSFAANGTDPFQNNYMLDGVDNNSTQSDNVGGSAYAVLPPIDALQEFNIQTSNYSAALGRAAGAVLNTTMKSGTNQFHGDAWEFVRNDAFDAADFFENAANIHKGEYRQNQYGFTFGGPIIIPKIYNGKNKTFFFVSYEGLRIRQGTPVTSTVPTLLERDSGYTDFSDLITGQSGSNPADELGRIFPVGTLSDQATTRLVTAGHVDPVTGLKAIRTGYLSDPLPGNILPANRLDPNAVRLLNLFPVPTTSGIFNNYTASPLQMTNANTVSARLDQNFSARDQLFARFLYSHIPEDNPQPMPGLAAGGSFPDGNLDTVASSSVISETHSFSSRMINEFRVGFIREATELRQPNSNVMGLPERFGIQGIPQYPGNGGIPAFQVGSLSGFGTQGTTPNFKFSNVWDVKENVTRIQGAHSIQAGFEYQYNFIPIYAPALPRGYFEFGDVSTFLLKPIPTTVPGGINNEGGASTVQATLASPTTATRSYYAGYLQDDWKVNHKLTLNLGLRYEYYSPWGNTHDSYANLIPGPPGAGAEFLFPASRVNNPVLAPAFLRALQKDGIALVNSSNVYGIAPKDDFAPRFGFAYQLKPKLVVRGGYGLFYGGFENNTVNELGSFSYPFVFNYTFNAPTGHPITPDNSIGLIENGLVNVPLTNPGAATSGFTILGQEYRAPTPYTQATNLTIQEQLTPNQSIQIAYVGTFGRHLELNSGMNNPAEILPPSTNPQNYVPYPTFARNLNYITHQGSSNYNALQATFERRFSSGLNMLGDYTWSKCRNDAKGLLVNDVGGYRAPDIPGFGIQGDYGLCTYDIRQAFHFSGGYGLPFGPGRHFLANAGGVTNALAGGWSANWILTLQDGQPLTVPCNIGPAQGVGCAALLVPGQSVIAGKHDVSQWLNSAAFANPPFATAIGQSDLAPLGGMITQAAGPGFHRLDFSLFKQFQTSESTRLEFRAEFFNLANIPNFANPSLLNFNSSSFGRISKTRDSPSDPRQIQFALKFYW